MKGQYRFIFLNGFWHLFRLENLKERMRSHSICMSLQVQLANFKLKQHALQNKQLHFESSNQTCIFIFLAKYIFLYPWHRLITSDDIKSYQMNSPLHVILCTNINNELFAFYFKMHTARQMIRQILGSIHHQTIIRHDKHKKS